MQLSALRPIRACRWLALDVSEWSAHGGEVEGALTGPHSSLTPPSVTGSRPITGVSARAWSPDLAGYRGALGNITNNSSPWSVVGLFSGCLTARWSGLSSRSSLTSSRPIRGGIGRFRGVASPLRVVLKGCRSGRLRMKGATAAGPGRLRRPLRSAAVVGRSSSLLQWWALPLMGVLTADCSEV